MNLKAFGWTVERQAAFAAYAGTDLLPGRVIGEHRTHFQVATDIGELTAEITGKLRNDAVERSDLPGVGDFVALRLTAGDGPAIIEAVLPRTSALVRQASAENRPQLLAANIDVAFIVMALDGDFNLARLHRYLALVRDSGAEAVIVANKIDLATDATGAAEQIADTAPGVAIHPINAKAANGIADLERYFKNNQTVVLIGSSGAGKSTLTNQLLGRAVQATQEVRAHDSRGRHTTTHRQLFIRPTGGSVIDTPGIRGLELWNDAPDSQINFDDIEALAANCRFRDCRHASEPACAVRAAVARGDLDEAHLASYLQRSPASNSGSRR